MTVDLFKSDYDWDPLYDSAAIRNGLGQVRLGGLKRLARSAVQQITRRHPTNPRYAPEGSYNDRRYQALYRATASMSQAEIEWLAEAFRRAAAHR